MQGLREYNWLSPGSSGERAAKASLRPGQKRTGTGRWRLRGLVEKSDVNKETNKTNNKSGLERAKHQVPQRQIEEKTLGQWILPTKGPSLDACSRIIFRKRPDWESTALGTKEGIAGKGKMEAEWTERSHRGHKVKEGRNEDKYSEAGHKSLRA